MKNLFRALILLPALGCVIHPLPYVDNHRKYLTDDYASSQPVPEAGSIYNVAAAGLFQDTRAARLGDIITIKVDESEVASIAADTNLSRDSSVNLSIPQMFNMVNQLARSKMGNINPTNLAQAELTTSFTGSGSTSRTGSLVAVIQARVKRVLPNGDLYLEGHKIVSLNNEDHHLYISGVIRQEDVEPDNSVASERVADAQITFNGQGQVSEQQRQGWLMRLINWISPL